MTFEPRFDHGSFRDPEGRVFSANGRIFRTLSAAAADRMRSFEKDGRLRRLVDAGLIVPTTLTTASEAELDPRLCGEAILEHEKLPLVTYPYEWSFDMLRDAALKTLDLLEACLGMDMVLKDATPFNLSLHKNGMIFMDALSLDRYSDGQPWEGYSQFCREFLFPLMLTACKKIEFQPWLRGRLNGLSASDLSRTLGFGVLPFKGVWTHVHLPALLERHLLRKKDVDVRSRFHSRNFAKRILLRMVRQLKGIVAGLKYRPVDSEWRNYENRNGYTAGDEGMKERFVEQTVRSLAGNVWVDLGCNSGQYALIAARAGKRAVGLDGDPAAVNGFYRRIRTQDAPSCHPAVYNLLNPSPSMGWRLAERPSLNERLRSDRFLALALVHHVCISNNVPLAEFVGMLADFGEAGVVEWVDKEDPMVRRLLRNRVDVFPDYTWARFRACLENLFEIHDVHDLLDGKRRLVSVKKKKS